jgi:2-polyprenyl-3-methyl-5-hydroxy-6-metoxy-1,4-benzoquinol methylase
MLLEMDTNTAIDRLLKLDGFRDNPWFLEQYWPENSRRVLMMLSDARARLAPESSRVLDIGCGNGYVSLLFAMHGFRVTATDIWKLAERDASFKEHGVDYFQSNFNDTEPFKGIADESFQLVLLGEVFEHVLNHPLGLLREIRRVLSRKGILILTTPNPSTLVNAARILFDRYSLWGTKDFIGKAKINGNRIIHAADIHYREYTVEEVTWALKEAGFATDQVKFLGMGSSKKQPLWKRGIKIVAADTLMRLRPFASTSYIIAVRQ